MARDKVKVLQWRRIDPEVNNKPSNEWIWILINKEKVKSLVRIVAIIVVVAFISGIAIEVRGQAGNIMEPKRFIEGK